MEAISYSLQGNTPQPFLEEIRCSLSTFQQSVATNLAGDLKKRFWARMFDALLRTVLGWRSRFLSRLKEGLERDVLFAPISMLAASVLVAVYPAESVPTFREEICSELKMTKVNFLSHYCLLLRFLFDRGQHEFEQVSAWFEGVESTFMWIGGYLLL